MIRQLYVSGDALHHSYIHGHFVRPKMNKLKETTTFKQVYVGFENLTSLHSSVLLKKCSDLQLKCLKPQTYGAAGAGTVPYFNL